MSISNHTNNSEFKDNTPDIPDTYDLEDDMISEERSSESSETYGEYLLPDEEDYRERDSINSLEDDEEENESWNGEINQSQPSPFTLMLKIMSTPVNGWKALKRSRYSLEKISLKLFYPLIIAAGLSNLTSLFYESGVDAGELIISIIFTSITFFFGYYTAILGGGMLLCKETKEVLRTDFGKEFIMYSVATTTLFYILFRLLPMAAPIIAFFPIWTVYIMDKGLKFLKVPKDKSAQTLVILSILVIGSLLLWDWILSLMIPD